MRQTHTFAELSVSGIVFDEIEEKLAAAGYQHAFTLVRGCCLATDIQQIEERIFSDQEHRHK